MTVISDLSYNVGARDPFGDPVILRFSTATPWGHARDDAHWYAEKVRGILISYLFCSYNCKD